MRKPGYIVKTKTGKKGRTYHEKNLINGKVPVYLEKEGTKFQFEDKAILCDPTTLSQIGFID